ETRGSKRPPQGATANGESRVSRGLPAKPIEDRFWAKVEKTDTCWLWTAATNPKGYGQFFWKRGDSRYSYTRPAHIVSYELSVGPIPEGKELDHICRNRRCVNPSHLEPITHRENLMRGDTIPSHKRMQDKCIHGHPFTR